MVVSSQRGWLLVPDVSWVAEVLTYFRQKNYNKQRKNLKYEYIVFNFKNERKKSYKAWLYAVYEVFIQISKGMKCMKKNKGIS